MENANPSTHFCSPGLHHSREQQGTPWLLQPPEHQFRHFHVFSWLANQAPFPSHSCRHRSTVTTCHTCCCPSPSSKAHPRSRVCDNSSAAVPAGCLSRLAFVLVQVTQEELGWYSVVHQQEQSLLLQQKGSKDETCKPLITMVSY